MKLNTKKIYCLLTFSQLKERLKVIYHPSYKFSGRWYWLQYSIFWKAKYSGLFSREKRSLYWLLSKLRKPVLSSIEFWKGKYWSSAVPLKRKRPILCAVLFFVILSTMGFSAHSQDRPLNVRNVPIDEFIVIATQNDTAFEEILIDELSLQYRKDINLPARDIVLEVKGQYDFFLSQDREEPEAEVSLSKLFPYSGTELEAGYKSTPSFTSTTSSSEFTFLISQSIAENAFGKSTRLQDKIIGMEIDVAKHQIIEAYEDYLAVISDAYYDWYEAYENLGIGRSSYEENLKLLGNIKERQRSRIAVSIDVNKINIQVLAKKEKLVDLEEKYDKALNIIKVAMRYEGDKILEPEEPTLYESSDGAVLDINFEQEYEAFKKTSRTYQILDLLEEKSSLQVDKDADDLLPSIKLLLGYKVTGDDFGINNENNKAYAGVSMEWPFGDQVDRAEYETSKITLDKTRLTTRSTHYRLYTDLKNLYREMEKEGNLILIADEKIKLAQAVVVDETENYSFGKVTLNDFIQAVNTLDNNRFSKVTHSNKLRTLKIEWMRLTDQLINRHKGDPSLFVRRSD